ncbi:MAG: hypothetical protein ACRCWM_09030 [Sarcina sp.]
MAYLPNTTTNLFPDEAAVQAILDAEAGILDCMAEYFCSPNGVVGIINSAGTVPEKLILLNSILGAYANKENSIACVLQASARKIAADSNVLPCKLSCNCDCDK